MPRYTCLLHIDAPDGTIAERMHTAIGVFIAESMDDTAGEVDAARASLCDLSTSERDDEIRATAREFWSEQVEFEEGTCVSEGDDTGPETA